MLLNCSRPNSIIGAAAAGISSRRLQTTAAACGRVMLRDVVRFGFQGKGGA
jgi:hypothetical protein